ncbi:MAG: hypothetical protein ACOYJI_05425 [Anaerovoracaceae bacterium]
MGSYDEADAFCGSARFVSKSGADENSINESLSIAFYRNIRSERTRNEADSSFSFRYDI